jgi:hypothetical protein
VERRFGARGSVSGVIGAGIVHLRDDRPINRARNGTFALGPQGFGDAQLRQQVAGIVCGGDLCHAHSLSAPPQKKKADTHLPVGTLRHPELGSGSIGINAAE